MKRIVFIFLTIFLVVSVSAREIADTVVVASADSLRVLSSKEMTPADKAVSRYLQQADQNYKLYPTQNMWTFLKLNTANGMIDQVQFSTDGWEYRFQSSLNDVPLVGYQEDVKSDRFELYPTENMYNFLLPDMVDGRCWQVQWGKKEQRMIVRIY